MTKKRARILLFAVLGLRLSFLLVGKKLSPWTLIKTFSRQEF